MEFFHGKNINDIKRYIESLSDTNKAILKRLTVIGLSEQEIADELGLTEGSVKFRIRTMTEQIAPDGKTMAGLIASAWASGYGRKWTTELFGESAHGDEEQC